ncbi:creatininase [Paraburkholderia sp. BL10I2N1]|uniref:creatininase n=1 Tax=Paraburkholderia sp. BL10I2N1 TaxID=1938796 RepID=UPI001060AF11|nr:creatininase [Paraburkholderia sp. BL10I2N1]TDN58709.1 creatinine amidohydrolase [Paraburkholderia sp. BL10I2N1]
MKTNMMAEMTWVEYQNRLKTEPLAVLLPVGALEQHGHHLPMGTDHLLPTAICKGIADRVPAIVAPPIAYGYKSQPRMGGGNHFPGTTSLDGGTLTLVVRDIIKELARHGVKRLAVMNGHCENLFFAIEGIDLALRDLRYEGINDLKIVRFDYWDFTTPATLDKCFPEGFPGFALEHAAVLETSMGLHVFPELVRMERLVDDLAAVFPPYDVHPTRQEWVPPSGVLSPAKGATVEKGRTLFNEYVDRISDALRKEFAEAA